MASNSQLESLLQIIELTGRRTVPGIRAGVRATVTDLNPGFSAFPPDSREKQAKMPERRPGLTVHRLFQGFSREIEDAGTVPKDGEAR